MTDFGRAGRVLIAGVTVLATLVLAAPPAIADDVRDDQWWVGSLKLVQAHRITQGAGVVVAVIDTGVWAGHPDLKGALVPGADFTAAKTSRNGYLDWDGHGTAVTGLIAARGHRGGQGLLGIAPQAKVMPLRMRDGGDHGGHPGQALRYAIKHGVDVVNMSFSTGDGWELREAVQAAAAADIVLVAGAGNQATADSGTFPGSYPEVVAVGAVDRNGALAKLSVTGPQLDLAAPGAGIVTLYRDEGSGYVNDNGTSLSSAIVAGAAALVRAKFPDLSAAEVVHRLEATAVDKGAPGADPQYGHGVIDVMAALTEDVPPIVAAPSVAPGNGDVATAAQPSPERSNTAVILLGAGCLGALALVGAGATIWVVRRRRHGKPTGEQ